MFSVTYVNSPMLSLSCYGFSESLTAFVIECIFVGYAMKKRGGKRTKAFLVVIWFTIC